MIIDIRKGLCVEAYSRRGQTLYRMGNSLTKEEDVADPDLRDSIKEFIKTEDEAALEEVQKLAKKEKDEEKDEEKEKTSDASEEPGADEDTTDEGTDEDSEGEDDADSETDDF